MPSLRVKILCFLLLICPDDLLFTQKTITFLPQLKFRLEKSERDTISSRRIIIWISIFNLKGQKKQSFRVKSALESSDHVPNS